MTLKQQKALVFNRKYLDDGYTKQLQELDTIFGPRRCYMEYKVFKNHFKGFKTPRVSSESLQPVLVFYQSFRQYLRLCDWESSNQLPRLASQAVDNNRRSITPISHHTEPSKLCKLIFLHAYLR